MYSLVRSCQQQLPNGNVLITESDRGRLLEVTRAGEIVWEYWNPYNYGYRLADGTAAQPIGPFKYAQFRATHISADHPAIAGKELSAKNPQPKPFVLEMPPARTDEEKME